VSRLVPERSAELRLADRKIASTADMVDSYHQQIREHGFTPRSLFYTNVELHTAKIAQYASLARLLLVDCPKVMDVGCGYGSLVPFLPPCDYVGIDLVEEFIVEARRRYPGIRFECTALESFTEAADWVLIPGVMGSVVDPDAMIDRAWALCRRGLAVDFIDASKYKGTSLNSYNISACVAKLLLLGSRHVEVMSGDGADWSILVARRSGLWLAASDSAETAKRG
jgi:2-polyprenyl-3-methyl-5-hydroxy-6-metoxy-1,4-benzoquinol methylase